MRSWPALTVTRRIDTRLAHVHDLAFAPTGAILAAAGGAPAEGGACELFEWPSGRLILHRESHEDVVYSIAWQPDGLAWFTAGGDKRVIQHSLDGSVKQRFSGHSQSVLAVACPAGGKHLVSAGRDRSLRVWDVAGGRLVSTLNNHTNEVLDLALRPGSLSPLAMVASASTDRTVRFWQPTIGRMVRFARLSSEPLAIDWTPGGDRLVAACRDGHLRVIDPATVEVVADIDAIDGWAYTVRVSPDGHDALVGGSDGQLRRVGLDERR